MKKINLISAVVGFAFSILAAGCSSSYDLVPSKEEQTIGSDNASARGDYAQTCLDLTFTVLDIAESNGKLQGQTDKIYQQSKEKLKSNGGSYLVIQDKGEKDVVRYLRSSGDVLFSYDYSDYTFYVVKSAGATALCSYDWTDKIGVYYTVQ